MTVSNRSSLIITHVVGAEPSSDPQPYRPRASRQCLPRFIYHHRKPVLAKPSCSGGGYPTRTRHSGDCHHPSKTFGAHGAQRIGQVHTASRIAKILAPDSGLSMPGALACMLIRSPRSLEGEHSSSTAPSWVGRKRSRPFDDIADFRGRG